MIHYTIHMNKFSWELYDVSEKIQKLVDNDGETFINLSSRFPLLRTVDDRSRDLAEQLSLILGEVLDVDVDVREKAGEWILSVDTE